MTGWSFTLNPPSDTDRALDRARELRREGVSLVDSIRRAAEEFYLDAGELFAASGRRGGNVAHRNQQKRGGR